MKSFPVEAMYEDAVEHCQQFAIDCAAGMDEFQALAKALYALRADYQRIVANLDNQPPRYMIEWENIAVTCMNAWELSMCNIANPFEKETARAVFAREIKSIVVPRPPF